MTQRPNTTLAGSRSDTDPEGYPFPTKGPTFPVDHLLAGLTALLDLRDAYVYTKDMAGRYLYVNQKVADLFRLPVEEILGKDDTHFFNMEEVNDLRRNDQMVMETGNTIECEEKNVIRPSGEIRYYRSIKKPVRNHAGEIIGICGISTDITERKLDQQTLADREFKLEAIIDNSPSVLSLKTPDGRYALANPNFQHIHHLSENEIIGKTDLDLYPANVANMFRNNDRLVLETQTRHSIEEMVPVDGHMRHFMSHMFPVFGLSGNVVYVCRISLDITEKVRDSERLLHQDELLRQMSSLAHVGGWEFDPSTGLGEWTEEVARIHDVNLEGPVSTRHGLEFFHGEYRKKIEQAIQDAMESGKTGDFELEMITAKGNRKWIRTICHPIAQNGKVIKVRGAIQDITERKRTESELQVAATTFESQDGVMITDGDLRILRVNSAFTRITGYSADEVIHQHPRILQSGRHDAKFYERMWDSITHTGQWSGEIWNRRKDGTVYPETLSISAVRNMDGSIKNYVGTFIDISLRKQAEAQAEHLAFHDQLTDLPNRRLIIDRIQHALSASVRSAKKCALLLIDLDNFKQINDTHGHAVGDLILREVAERLGKCLREEDTLARPGGDEFLVLLEGLSEDTLEAAELAEHVGMKLVTALRNSFWLNQQEFRVTSSIGMTVFHGPAEGPAEELIGQADIAMYEAKKAGRNALRFFDRKVQELLAEKASLETDLRHALDRHQLMLHYQLQVGHPQRPIGAEALARWYHPEHQWVSPARFIALAEESDLILDIGKWVLETACAQLATWQNHTATRDLVLAVNVSARQINQPDFVHEVHSVVHQHCIDPRRLKLEITESMLLGNVEDTIVVMNALKKIGIQLSLDDFGTGYSSLAYLKRLPLDQLKIDQSFVRDIAADANDRSIVKTIIAMARSLGLDVIAEGVETETQQQFLELHGCLSYQGYLYGRPVSMNEFERILPSY